MSGDNPARHADGLSLVSRTDTPRPGRTESYTVKPGDTLTGIAMQVYGNPQRWAEVYDANRDKIDNPDLLPTGETLRIPRL